MSTFIGTSANRRRVAILFPADPAHGLATDLMQSRFTGIARALDSAGMDAVGAPWADAFSADVRAQLLSADAVLVWLNPIEGGRDRTILNAMLRDVASQGVLVSAHPDVIDRMGTKEMLYRTRTMGWGCDTRFYASAEAMGIGLRDTMTLGGARVLKQIRGQGGDGVWKVKPAAAPGISHQALCSASPVLVRHAKRGSVEEQMALQDFIAMCAPYFATGGMIEQPYQERLPEGMIRCYVVGDRVAGFGEQLVNALYPAPAGGAAADAPPPGPRLYYPPTRPDFQALKHKLEDEWIGELCRSVGVAQSELPVIWDADFLYGPKDANGVDTYVLCEINVSSEYPFPEAAMSPLVERVSALLCPTA
ncbi:MAG: Cj0069 family protein [Hyphomicrobiaceae bacterium]